MIYPVYLAREVQEETKMFIQNVHIGYDRSLWFLDNMTFAVQLIYLLYILPAEAVEVCLVQG